MAEPAEIDRRQHGRRVTDLVADPRQAEIYGEVSRERDRMDAGVHAETRDDGRSAADWSKLRYDAEIEGISEISTGHPVAFRACLIKIAALTIAEVEAVDRQMDRGDL